MVGWRGRSAAVAVWMVGALLIGWAPARGAAPGTFHAVGKMAEARANPGTTMLSDGRVLITGGLRVIDGREQALAAAELFDPKTDSFAALPPMASRRFLHAAVRGADGRVYLIGGDQAPGVPSSTLSAVEVFDPSTKTFAPAGSLTRPRVNHTASLLPDGRILVAGGAWRNLWATRAEIYNPATGKSEQLSQPLLEREAARAVTLPDGRVVIVGGDGGEGTGVRAIDIFDPQTNRFTSGGETVESRMWPAVALLPDGRILIAGGQLSWESSEGFSSVEIYDPATAQSAIAGELADDRSFAQAVALMDGTVLIAGGHRLKGAGERLPVQTAELFDPVTGKVSAVEPTTGPRTAFAAVRLLDGRALLLGGGDGVKQLDTAEVYVPGN